MRKPTGKLMSGSNPQAQQKSKECSLNLGKLDLCATLVPLQSSIPVRKGTSFKLKFWNLNQGTIDGPYSDPGLNPHIWLWMEMPSGSHGSLPVTVTQSLDSQGVKEAGVYDVKGAVFTMPGEWELHLDLLQSDGAKVDEAVQKIWI